MKADLLNPSKNPWARPAFAAGPQNIAFASPAATVGGMLRLLRGGFFLLFMAALAAGGGCTLLGFAASKLPQTVKPRYQGFAGQSVAVMVWADRGVRTDFEGIQLDLAGTVQTILQNAKADEFEKTLWPYEARSIVRFQREHPEIEAQSATEIAERIGGITRLIYIEIGNFTTHSDDSLQLMRGQVTANLKVIEITGGKAAVVYDESNLHSLWPKNQREGVVNIEASRVYQETVRQFAAEIANRFITHYAED